jgi:hypothetical protein
MCAAGTPRQLESYVRRRRVAPSRRSPRRGSPPCRGLGGGRQGRARANASRRSASLISSSERPTVMCSSRGSPSGSGPGQNPRSMRGTADAPCPPARPRTRMDQAEPSTSRTASSTLGSGADDSASEAAMRRTGVGLNSEVSPVGVSDSGLVGPAPDGLPTPRAGPSGPDSPAPSDALSPVGDRAASPPAGRTRAGGGRKPGSRSGVSDMDKEVAGASPSHLITSGFTISS